jgi:hypothetical protein
LINLRDLSEQFDAKLEAIRSYDRETSEVSEEYRKALPKLEGATSSLNDRLPRYCGARILEGGPLVRPFKFRWRSRPDALDWVDSVLRDTEVGAVDGSQIYSDKNFEIPIAVVQTGSVYNKHNESKEYGRFSSTGIITPDEFEASKVYAFSSEFVDAKRFEKECQALIEIMESHKEIFVFLDGALVLSHINVVNKNIRDIYIRAVLRLLAASGETRNPVIGYIDTSIPRDLTLMMHFLFGIKMSRLSDPHLLAPLLDWGDRTSVFLCDRDDRRRGDLDSPSVLDNYGRFRDQVAFFYIRMSLGLPSRVELPRWAYEAGLTEKIADIIRAETVLRGDYPDILLRAHENALIETKDHELFYKVLENFCKAHGIRINKSAKYFHKMRR